MANTKFGAKSVWPIFDVGANPANAAAAASYVGEDGTFSGIRDAAGATTIVLHDEVTPGGVVVGQGVDLAPLDARVTALEAQSDVSTSALVLNGTDLQAVLSSGTVLTLDATPFFDNINVVAGLYALDGTTTDIPLTNGANITVDTALLATDAELAAAIAALAAEEFVNNIVVNAAGVATFLTNLGNTAGTLDVAAVAESVEEHLLQPTIVGSMVTFPMDSGISYTLSLASLDESLTDNGDGSFTFDDGEGNNITFNTDTDDQALSSPDGSIALTPVPQPGGQVDYNMVVVGDMVAATDPDAGTPSTLASVLTGMESRITAAQAAATAAASGNTTNASLAVVGTDLVLTDSDGNTVQVGLSVLTAGVDPSSFDWSSLSPASALALAQALPAGSVDASAIDGSTWDAATSQAIIDALAADAIPTDTIDFSVLSAADIALLEAALGGIDTDVSATSVAVNGTDLEFTVTEDGVNYTGTIALATVAGAFPAGSINASALAAGGADTDISGVTYNINAGNMEVAVTEDGVTQTGTLSITDLVNAFPAGAIPATALAAGVGDTDVSGVAVTVDATNLTVGVTEDGVTVNGVIPLATLLAAFTVVDPVTGLPTPIADVVLAAADSGMLGVAPNLAPVQFTVGASGDFGTLNEAFAEASKLSPAYVQAGIGVDIHILAGEVISEQLLFSQIDMGYITITAADPLVTVERSALTINKQFNAGSETGGFTATNAFPFIGVYDHSVGPVLDALFSMDATGTAAERMGILVADNSSMVIRPGAGVQNSGDVGLQLVNSSRVSAIGANFDNSGDRGVWARWGCTVSFGGGSAQNCGWTAFQMHNSVGSCQGAQLMNSGHYGVRSRRGSTVEAQGCDVSGSAGRGFNVNEGSILNARDATALNIGDTENSLGLNCSEGSTLNLKDATISGNNALALVRAGDGGQIFAEGATITANAGAGPDIEAVTGGRIVLDGVAGADTFNCLPALNAVSPDGWISSGDVRKQLLQGAGPDLQVVGGVVEGITHEYHLILPETSGVAGDLDNLRFASGVGQMGARLTIQVDGNNNPLTLTANGTGAGRIRIGANSANVLDNGNDYAITMVFQGGGFGSGFWFVTS